MRNALLTAALLTAVVVMLAGLLNQPAPLPREDLGVEQVCADVIQQVAPDHSWVRPDRDEQIGSRGAKAVALALLPFHDRHLVQVAGVLHVEFEWIALYPSASAIREGGSGPWVSFESLWPGERYWHTKAPSISDRCVVVEGTYFAAGSGQRGMFDGAIRDVVRLDVWSAPHRPFIGIPPPPRTIGMPIIPASALARSVGTKPHPGS